MSKNAMTWLLAVIVIAAIVFLVLWQTGAIDFSMFVNTPSTAAAPTVEDEPTG